MTKIVAIAKTGPEMEFIFFEVVLFGKK